MFEDFKEKIRKRIEAEHEKRLFAKVLGNGKPLAASFVMEKERMLFGEKNHN